MADRSSLLRSNKNPKLLGYSSFDPGGSIDSEISSSGEGRVSKEHGSKSAGKVVEDAERVSISWENIQVFVEQPGPSFIKRLCFGKNENEAAKRKQILFNGRLKLLNDFQFYGIESGLSLIRLLGVSYHTVLIGWESELCWPLREPQLLDVGKENSHWLRVNT